MLKTMADGLLDEVPHWVYLSFVSVMSLALLIAAVPAVQHMLDRGMCTSAMADANDFSSFDAAYAECEALGIVPPRK